MSERATGLVVWGGKRFYTLDDALRRINEKFGVSWGWRDLFKAAVHGRGEMLACYARELPLVYFNYRREGRKIYTDSVRIELFTGFFVPWYTNDGRAYMDALTHDTGAGNPLVCKGKGIKSIDEAWEGERQYSGSIADLEAMGFDGSGSAEDLNMECDGVVYGEYRPGENRFYVEAFELAYFMGDLDEEIKPPKIRNTESQKLWILAMLENLGIDVTKLPDDPRRAGFKRLPEGIMASLKEEVKKFGVSGKTLEPRFKELNLVGERDTVKDNRVVGQEKRK